MELYYSMGAHVQSVRQIGYSGLIIFVLISIYFSVPQRSKERNILRHPRAARLLVPWLFWFFIYGIINTIMGKSLLPGGGIRLIALLAGTNIILWYLPFIFLMGIIAFAFDQVSEDIAFVRKYRLIPFAALSLLSLICTPLLRPWSLSLGNPWAQWFHAAPAVVFGLTMRYLIEQHSGHLRASLFAGIIVLISIWLILIWEYNGVGIPYLLGVLLFSLHLYWKFDAGKSHTILEDVRLRVWNLSDSSSCLWP